MEKRLEEEEAASSVKLEPLPLSDPLPFDSGWMLGRIFGSSLSCKGESELSVGRPYDRVR